MPYKANSELPAEIKSALPVEAQSVFRRVFNTTSAEGKSEERSFATAWTAVKNGWQKDSDGKWKRIVKKHLTTNSSHDIIATNIEKRDFNVFKVDDSLGLVFGYAIVCKQNGVDYFDTQGDHIPEDAMLKASADFMENSRASKTMHKGEDTGQVVFAFPLTEDIAKAMNIQTEVTGLMIAIKPNSDEILQKYRNSEYTGFSIGGSRILDEEVND